MFAKKTAFLQESQNPAASDHKETFSDFCTIWLTCNQDAWKPSTTAKYHSMIGKHIRPRFGKYLVTELIPKQIDHFSYELLHEKKLQIKTVRDILALLHKMLTDLSLWTNGTVKPVRIIYPKADRKEFRVLTSKEQILLEKHLHQDLDIYRFAVLLALNTGLRVGEICGLRWENISTESKTLTVKHTVQRIKNPEKNGVPKTILHLGTPKTRTSCRTIPLTDGITRLCETFQSDQPDTFILTGTLKYAEPRILQRKLKLYTSQLNLQDVHFHTLRHTFATRCVEVGCDIKTLSEILGHSNVTLTMNRYVHPDLDLKRENMKKLEQAGFGCAVR